MLGAPTPEAAIDKDSESQTKETTSTLHRTAGTGRLSIQHLNPRLWIGLRMAARGRISAAIPPMLIHSRQTMTMSREGAPNQRVGLTPS